MRAEESTASIIAKTCWADGLPSLDERILITSPESTCPRADSRPSNPPASRSPGEQSLSVAGDLQNTGVAVLWKLSLGTEWGQFDGAMAGRQPSGEHGVAERPKQERRRDRLAGSSRARRSMRAWRPGQRL